MLKSSYVYSSLDCSSEYYHIALSPKAQKESDFITPIGKFKFKKVPFGLAQAPAYFHMLINEVLKGLPFVFRYLDDILIFSDNIENISNIKNCV